MLVLEYWRYITCMECDKVDVADTFKDEQPIKVADMPRILEVMREHTGSTGHAKFHVGSGGEFLYEGE